MHLVTLICLLLLRPLLLLSAYPQLNSSLPLRFWLDEYAFTPGETTLLKEEIEAAGQEFAVVSGETKRLHFAVKGYDAINSWDIYWTGRQACERALTKIRPHQRVNCVPGIASLARKNRLIATLVQHYGDGAFEMTPRSWLLPDQYWHWRLQAAAQNGGKNQLWVLKQDVHRGKGVHVMKETEAINEARLFDWHEEHKYVLVQQYMQNQLEVASRRFYIRLWVLVTSVTPLKVYLFDGGVVIFGSVNKKKRSDFDMPADDEEYIVNLWTQDREASQPISMAVFQQHINNVTESNSTFDSMWTRMQTIIGYSYAAGLNSMRFSSAMLAAPAGSSFEVFGVDMLVDTDYQPWLVEINAVPSLARKVVDCSETSGKDCIQAEHAANAFDSEKVALMHGLFRMLQTPPGQDEGDHADLLSNHIRELNVAAENRFLPILMVPEAVQYQHEQKKNIQLQKQRRHEPGVIRAPVLALNRAPQRELLSVKNTAQNDTVAYSPTRTQPSMFMMFLYTIADLTLHVWYWLPTRQEMLLWLSQYLPFADVLCMDYFRFTLSRRTLYTNLEEIPLHPLDQAIHDTWLHRQ